MAIIQKPYNFSANTSIKPSEVNANIDTIYNAFNGNISGANLADNAITTVKITDGTINPDNIADGAITTAKIADDSVIATKIDWASTGTDGGIWWEELGRTTLSGSADIITVSNLEPRNFLRIYVYILISGTYNITFRFNGDSGSNYASRESSNGAAENVQTSISGGYVEMGNTTVRIPLSVLDVTNIQTQEKMVIGQRVDTVAAGAGTAPSRKEAVWKWTNTTDYINSFSAVQGTTGDYIAGSEIIVLGHN